MSVQSSASFRRHGLPQLRGNQLQPVVCHLRGAPEIDFADACPLAAKDDPIAPAPLPLFLPYRHPAYDVAAPWVEDRIGKAHRGRRLQPSKPGWGVEMDTSLRHLRTVDPPLTDLWEFCSHV